MRVYWGVAMLLFIGIIGIQDSFAEKIVSIEKTVDVDRKSLTHSISSLDKYSQILPDYIHSSELIGDNTGKMQIGLDWISIDTEIKFMEFSDKVALEVISGGFKGTKLYVVMNEQTSGQTNIVAEINLHRTWYMELLTSFVSDDDIESMLNTSLDGLVEYTKNPQTHETVVEKEEKFCIFNWCF